MYNGTATGSPWSAKCVNGYVDGYLVYSDTTKTTLCGCSSAATGAITISNSVTMIGEYAFAECSGLTSITCYAITPPACVFLSCFYDVSMSIPVYVPAESTNAYKQTDGWEYFTNILPIVAEEISFTDSIVTADNHSVTIAWPQIENADTYTLEIQKNDESVCMLTFNGQGQFTNIAFTLARNGERPANYATKTSTGYQFTVTGLESGTAYTYAVTAKDAAQQVLQIYVGNFTTTGGTATDLLPLPHEGKDGIGSVKFIRNGHLLIEHNGIRYNAHGARVK